MQRSPLFSGKFTMWIALIMGLFLSSGCLYLPRSRMIGDQYYFMDIPACAHGADQSPYAPNNATGSSATHIPPAEPGFDYEPPKAV